METGLHGAVRLAANCWCGSFARLFVFDECMGKIFSSEQEHNRQSVDAIEVFVVGVAEMVL